MPSPDAWHFLGILNWWSSAGALGGCQLVSGSLLVHSLRSVQEFQCKCTQRQKGEEKTRRKGLRKAFLPFLSPSFFHYQIPFLHHTPINLPLLLWLAL